MANRTWRNFNIVTFTLLCAAGAAMADMNSSVMVIYDTGDTTPAYSMWNGTNWGTAGGTALPSVGGKVRFVTLRNSTTRDEFACLTQDEYDDVNVMFGHSGVWTTPVEVCTNVNEGDDRVTELAYEQRSGHALILYHDYEENNLGYYVYNGATLSGEFNFTMPGDGSCDYNRLYPMPGSDKIMLLTTRRNGSDILLLAKAWDGDSFGPWVTLETTLQADIEGSYDAAYETQSRHLLVVYSEKDKTQPRYRTWDGTTWSNEGQAPSVGAVANWVRLEADPASDKVLMTTFDYGLDINANFWSGSAWGTNVELETNAQDWQRRGFDIAYEPQGGRALVVYGELTQNAVRYRSWNGTTWSSKQNGPDIGDDTRAVQLESGLATGEIFVGVYDDGSDLEMMYWNGSTLSGRQTLHTSMYNGTEYIPFMIAVPKGRDPVYTDVSVAKGFNVQTTTDSSKGSGLHWGDLDNDGDLDSIISGGASSRILLNQYAGVSFTNAAFGGGDVRSQGAPVDLDNDGDLDFWGAAVSGANQEGYFQNGGIANFMNLGDVGFGESMSNEGTAAADIDGDGWCDIAMFAGSNGNWLGMNQKTAPTTLVAGSQATSGLNDPGDAGNGSFISSGDVDNDGQLDFFYHWNGGRLFLSKGDGTFTESTSGISFDTAEANKTGSAWADYDNDGDLDLYTPNYSAGGLGKLWQNNGGTFTDVAYAAGINDTLGQRSACWGDYDNDGDMDLYIVTRAGMPNKLYQNQGNGTFLHVEEGAEAYGDGHDAVFVDYDNDGDLDLAVTQEDATNTLLQNGINDDRYLKVRVLGMGEGGSNAAAVGVRVEVWDSTGTYYFGRREIGVARGYGGTEPMWLHFGGLSSDVTYQVRVFFTGWPVDEPYTTTVVPSLVSTTIGSTIIPQMLTIDESTIQRPLRIVKWREIRNSASRS